MIPFARRLAAALLGLLLIGQAQGAPIPLDTRNLPLCLTRIAGGLAHPWGLAQLPDGRFLVSERVGSLALIDGGEITRLAGLPEVSARGQGGLLDLALHPGFGRDAHGDGEHDWLYFTWSRPGPGGDATALSRARLGEARLTDLEHLFVQDRYSRPGRHYGSRLAWLPDGTLLMSVGERGVTPERAQDGGDHAGSILRLTDSGEVPADNPFVDDPAVLDEIFSLGHRNPQGLVVADDGTAWSTEHGPRTGDELNRLVPGANYGWPVVTRGRDYVTNLPIGRNSAAGMRDPVYLFTGRFAPSGLAQASSPAFAPWRGDLLAGGLRSEALLRLHLEGDAVVEQETILQGEIGRVRTVLQGNDGMIYLLDDDASGSLWRLSPAADTSGTAAQCAE
ncbi:PQQ-dependent sugar dehydrogenase [Halomonas organivorans]|uniref:Glucose/arabinose dehydrogenase n=1 Tax=Halomonas organivorans TaxID=257772 RepID=A0A7W5G6J2_9GAMM|nr:PQQ-dependent sugar dehydrogenase [Halomonas organivorans]MBB3141546.1 glucose/arabinose dehydrogenase [Halomonas organivorans]